MAAFVYTALNADGTRTTGEMQANDRGDAMRRLERKGLRPVSVKIKDEGGGTAVATQPQPDRKSAKSGGNGSQAIVAAGDRSGAAKSGPPAKSPPRTPARTSDDRSAVPTGPVKLKRADLIMFTEELSDLLGAGLQLEPALRIMESRDELSAVKDVTAILRARIRDGSSFSNALKAASPSFGELYCNLAAAGEISGALPKILRRQAEYLVSVASLQSKVTVAMIYPACLMFAGLAVFVVVVTYLIPTLTGLLATMGKELPWVAKAAMQLGDMILTWWWLIGLTIGLGIWGFQKLITIPAYRETWDRQKLSLPIFGPMMSQRFFVQFLETLSNLVGNGLPLLRALELTRDATVNRHLRGLLTKVIAMVGEGGSLSRSLRKVGFFPSLLTDMITVGEQTGDLEHALERTAQRYEKELQKVIDRGTALIAPVILFFMAIVVGVMAYLMLSIILDSVSSIKR